MTHVDPTDDQRDIQEIAQHFTGDILTATPSSRKLNR